MLCGAPKHSGSLAGRHAVWIALAAVLWLYCLISPNGIEEYVTFTAIAYFGFLALAH